MRRWRRYHFDVPVRVVVSRNSREIVLHGRGTSMNEGGIAVKLDVELTIGHQVEIEFTPPYAALPVRVRGAVRNSAGNRYGLEFLTGDYGQEQEVALFRSMLRGAAGHLAQ
jgi:hypothetical protein